MRILAAMAIILLHLCSTMTEHTDVYALTKSQDVVLTIILSLQRWAVPCFFMMTGALMLNTEKTITVRQSLIYSRRIALAILIFGVSYALMEQIVTNRSFSPDYLLHALWAAICNKSWGHLWYLYVCFGIYLGLPFLKAMINGLCTRNLWYLVGLMLIATMLIPVINEHFNWNIAFEFPIGTYVITYLLLGKLLNECPPKFLSRQWINISIIIITALLIIFVTVTDQREKLIFDMNFSPIVAVYAVAMFMIFRNSNNKLKSTKFIWKLDRLCFGIYIFHPIFIHLAYRFLKLTPMLFRLYGFALIVFWVCTFGLAAIVTYFLKKIPLVNQYLL